MPTGSYQLESQAVQFSRGPFPRVSSAVTYGVSQKVKENNVLASPQPPSKFTDALDLWRVRSGVVCRPGFPGRTRDLPPLFTAGTGAFALVAPAGIPATENACSAVGQGSLSPTRVFIHHK